MQKSILMLVPIKPRIKKGVQDGYIRGCRPKTLTLPSKKVREKNEHAWQAGPVFPSLVGTLSFVGFWWIYDIFHFEFWRNYELGWTFNLRLCGFEVEREWILQLRWMKL